jgi:AbrB family looped-hinge helix DNA binding protein
MDSMQTTLTERGQVSMPACIRRELGLKPGQALCWEKVSDQECRVIVVQSLSESDGRSMRGFMKPFLKDRPKTTSGWMNLLREGEQD